MDNIEEAAARDYLAACEQGGTWERREARRFWRSFEAATNDAARAKAAERLAGLAAKERDSNWSGLWDTWSLPVLILAGSLVIASVDPWFWLLLLFGWALLRGFSGGMPALRGGRKGRA